MEEDPSAQRQLDRCRGTYDIFALDVLRKCVDSLEGRYDKEQYVSVVRLVTYIGELCEVKDEKGANNDQEDASELPASNTATVLAFWFLTLAPALAPAESGAAGSRSRRCKTFEFFVLARDSLGIILDVEVDVDSGTGEQRSALSFQVRIARKDSR